MSAKLRLALWVTSMVLLVSVMVLVFVLVINRHSLPEDPASYLVEVVLDNANDVEYDRGTFEWNEMSVYKRGVYCSFYNTNGDLLLSADKEDMDFSGVPFMANKIRTVRSGGKEFYLYDYYVDMEVSGLWIRGVVRTDSHQGITDIILRLTIIILPIILIVTFLGALWISSRTFKPIEKIVATANSINDADDLTDRIALKRGPKEMKQLAGAFDRMFERLEKVFDAERQFTSDASHELRTPTAIILAECDRAKRKAKTPEDYRESIDNISEQGKRMSALIDELLGITRLQQGTERYPLSKGDLSEFVTLSSEEFVPAEDRGIRLEAEIETGIECSFNASLMSRVIYNLLQNAYKYGRDNGYVRLSLSRENNDAVIRVKDNGIGIKKEDLDKIWQRFWQADSARGAEGGNGLGLAMVKEIAELHGGSVTAESMEGRGSEFIFRLPAAS
ncbi:MAG: HAMP domain-containing histidine kinase [Mogibacterium sp.]|nr:HAMP domain-containing histidine kinase [Mogibacterium sp.]